MIKDLNDIYDTQGAEQDTLPPPGPGDGPKRGTTVQKPAPEPGPVRGAGAGYATVSPTNVNDFTKYMPEGVYDERGPREGGLESIRGQNQSVGEKIGRRMGNLVPNVVAGIIDMAGNVGALFSEWGDERDYSNTLNEVAAKIRDPLGQAYQHDTSTWAIGDSAWWLNNIFTTAEYAGAFAVGGAGIAKVLAGAADLAGGSAFVRGVAQLGTSALSSYAEAAQAGMQVYQEVYDNQLQKQLAKGLSVDAAKDQAKHIAAQSAATASQLGTILTMGMNSGAYGSFFRSEKNAALDIIGSRLAQNETASMGELGRVVRGTKAEDYMDKLLHHSSIRDKLQEMAAEGGEEVVQQFAQVTGTDRGKEGKTDGFFEQFGQLSHMVDRTADAQGALSFALGAAFGGLQHVLLHNILPTSHVDKLNPDGTPVQRFDKNDEAMVDKNGKPLIEKKWVTPRTAEHDFVRHRFENLKDAVATDFERFDQLNDDILAGTKAKDTLKVNEARDEIFNSGKLHAVRSGLVDPWIKTFEQIGNMEPADAVAAGYASDETDTSYKDKAQEAVNDIQHLRDMHDDLTKTYGSDEHVAPYVDMVFGRQADLYSSRKRMDAFKKGLEINEQKEREMAQVLDPTNTNALLDSYKQQRQSALEVNRQLVEDHAVLLSGDAVKIKRLLRKYRATGYGDGNVKASMIDLAQKLKAKQDEMISKTKTAEEAIYASTNYTSWLEKNPGKSFDEFINESNRRTALSAFNDNNRMVLARAETEYSIAQQNLSDMTSSKNVSKFSKKVAEWQEQAINQAQIDAEAKRMRLAELAKDKSTTGWLERIELNKIADAHAEDRDNAYNGITENNKQLSELRKQLEKKSITNDPLRVLSLRHQINDLEKQNRRLQIVADKADSLHQEYRVSTTAPTVDIPVDDVTGEEDGKITADAIDEPTTETDTPALSVEDAMEAELNAMGGEAHIEMPPVTVDDEMAAMEGASQAYEEMATEEDYDTQLKNVLPKVRDHVKNIIDNLINGEDFSLDALNSFIAKGLITQQAAHNLLLAARNYAAAINAAKQTPEEPASVTTTIPETVTPVIQIAEISEPDTPIINNSDPETAVVPENPGYHAGYKIIEAATNGATVTQGYEEGTYVNAEGKTVFRKVTLKDALNKELNESILKPGELKPNHPLIYQVDTDYDGPKMITDSLSWDGNQDVVADRERFEDYLQGSTTVKSSNYSNQDIENFKLPNRRKNISHNGKELEYPSMGSQESIKSHIEFIVDSFVASLNKGEYKSIDDLSRIQSIKDTKDMEESERSFILQSIKDRLKEKLGIKSVQTEPTGNKLKTDPRSVGNVPIKVMDAVTGKYLFHIHKLDWLNAKFPNTTDYRNVVQFLPDGEGGAIDNLAAQNEILMDLRNRIVERFNRDGSSSPGKIAQEGKGTGRLILNHVIEKKTQGMTIKSSVVPEFAYDRSDPDKSMLPDNKLQLVIGGDGGVLHSGFQFKFPGSLGFDSSQIPKGSVSAMLPAPNGQFMAAPLIGMKLVESGTSSPALNSVVRAIELYLLNDGSMPEITAEIKQLQANTGFNLGTPEGLKNFIEQFYTYSQWIPDSRYSPNIQSTDKAEKFIFGIDTNNQNITDKVKQIKAGFTMRSGNVAYANLVKGKLAPAFVKVLQEGFAQRSRAVNFTKDNIRGINSSGTFQDATYSPARGTTPAKWIHNSYENYNQYVKSFSKTPVYGRNKLSDGTHVYTANPHLPMDFSALRQEASLVVEPNPTASTVNITPDAPVVDSDLEDLSNFANFSYSIRKPQSVDAIGTAPDGARPLSMQTLEEISNFTPEEQHNGKTVQEVLDELALRGHTFIPDGYNPFSSCL